VVCAAVVATGVACGMLSHTPPPPMKSLAPLPGQATGVFTTANPTFAHAVEDFFWSRPEPTQPVEFPHKKHVEQNIGCTDYCHDGVTKSPVAGLPSVNTCMGCHASIATDKPEVQKFTAMQEKGLDLAWQRVYLYARQAHVRFNHAPHIAAKVECSTCHGDVANQTVARRNVDLDMGFCVKCHREKDAPNECLTCHY
jgi:Cytochrome c7 and related cytochrome c/Class III cytochrome C family